MFKYTKTKKSKSLFITSITLFSMMYHFGVSADNSFILDSPDTVINSYASVTIDLASGNNNIKLSTDSINNLNTPAFMKKGDTLMIIQMQGATIDNTDSPVYGNILDYNNSGTYEFITVKSISENEITLSQPLKNNYKSSGNIQIIKVPEYNSMIITKEGILTALPWNGKFGGVIALKVKNNILLNGNINASGTGFRGGKRDSKAPVNGISKYFSLSSGEGGEKGESIAGSQLTYDSLGGRYGRGAPANGGGGGNSHNAPGGGGANADNGNIWTGQGVMCSACEGSEAWLFDPGYTNNNLSMSSGGGRGGYSYSANNIDELTSAPGTKLWGGDNRREVGGVGGRPLNNIHSERLFFGGGGGAGQENNNSGGSGGNGGGIIYIFSDQISGSGNMNSNGNNGEDSHKINFGDAPGGGGGGGSIILKANSINGITINARGGTGGNQYIGDIPEAEGAGGGGGGGYVSVSSLGATINTNGGLGGITDSASMTKFHNNGSTDGALGILEIVSDK